MVKVAEHRKNERYFANGRAYELRTVLQKKKEEHGYRLVQCTERSQVTSHGLMQRWCSIVVWRWNKMSKTTPPTTTMTSLFTSPLPRGRGHILPAVPQAAQVAFTEIHVAQPWASIRTKKVGRTGSRPEWALSPLRPPPSSLPLFFSPLPFLHCP